MVRKCLIRKKPETVGEHIREARTRRRLLQKDVCKLLGVNMWTLINWETGKTSPALTDMKAIIAFLGYDPHPTQAVTLAERMVAYRRTHGLTIAAVAKRLGIDDGTWMRWEHGHAPWPRHRRLLEGVMSEI